MEPDSIRAASDLLVSLWQQGEVTTGLPPELRPPTRHDGYAIQAVLETRGDALYGWKIAGTSEAGRHHINIDGPIAGRILQGRVVTSGGHVPACANRMAVAEVEFAFRMGRDLPPRQSGLDGYRIEEVVDAIESLHAAIEIPDSRYADFTRVGAPQLIADDACAHWFVAADPSGHDWRSIDLSLQPAVGRVVRDGQVVLEREGTGAQALGDPRVALRWLVNELSALGITLHKGQMVTTGTCVQPLAIRAGDQVIADLGDLGRAIVTIG